MKDFIGLAARHSGAYCVTEKSVIKVLDVLLAKRAEHVNETVPPGDMCDTTGIGYFDVCTHLEFLERFSICKAVKGENGATCRLLIAGDRDDIMALLRSFCETSEELRVTDESLRSARNKMKAIRDAVDAIEKVMP